MINNEHAKEQRQILHEERQKKRVLFVFKKDLVAAYRKAQVKKTYKRLRVNETAAQWAREILTWKAIKRVFGHYAEMR